MVNFPKVLFRWLSAFVVYQNVAVGQTLKQAKPVRLG
jgi:hypothetical protein